MEQIPRSHQGIAVILYMLFSFGFLFFVIIYSIAKPKRTSNFIVKIILTKTQLIVYYTHQRIAKFNLNQLEFDWQNTNELLLSNTSNSEGILVDISGMLDEDKKELADSLNKCCKLSTDLS